MLTVAERLALRTGNAGKVVMVGETAELGGAVGLVGLREVVLSILGGFASALPSDRRLNNPAPRSCWASGAGGAGANHPDVPARRECTVAGSSSRASSSNEG